MSGIVSTGVAYDRQSLAAGAPIAEILDPRDVFVDWYIPNVRLIDPEIGKEVVVVFGKRHIPGTIAEILPVSAVYARTQQPPTGVRPATQIARVRFAPNALSPPLNASVTVRMHYSEFSARVGSALVGFLGFD
ncbi:HlyD family efflux transporter periplasmic adaptor subunit [Rhizobium sp. TH2]|nr:HlyD family efflux transporter periplasmic adaptor subunit [Rhizobium sp. TH2]